MGKSRAKAKEEEKKKLKKERIRKALILAAIGLDVYKRQIPHRVPGGGRRDYDLCGDNRFS